jgi:hypothetical protein
MTTPTSVRGKGSSAGRVRRFPHVPSPETRLQLIQRIGDAYGIVLLLILTTFVVSMTLPSQGWLGPVTAVAVAGLTAIVALTSSDVHPGRVRLATGAALVAVVAAILASAVPSDALLGLAFVIDALLLLVSAGTILRRVVRAAEVDFRTILGAVSVFTLLGLLFGFLFIALGRLRGGDVFRWRVARRDQGLLVLQLHDADHHRLRQPGVPAGDIGQILAVFEMLTGQVFLVTLAAGLVSL